MVRPDQADTIEEPIKKEVATLQTILQNTDSRTRVGIKKKKLPVSPKPKFKNLTFVGVNFKRFNMAHT